MLLTKDLYERIAAAKMFIDEHYASGIDLAAISGHACLSRFHFHRIFRQVYRHTPHQYLTRKRMDRAKELLAENMQVSDVSNELGYESATTFSLLFKKEIGFAPTYFRNIAWLRKQEAKSEPRKFIPHCFLESKQHTLG